MIESQFSDLKIFVYFVIVNATRNSRKALGKWKICSIFKSNDIEFMGVLQKLFP